MRHCLTLKEWTPNAVGALLDLAVDIKREPHRFHEAARRKVLVMIFEKPSLRTRISFEAGMAQMGGHAVYYDLSTSPLGAGKETIEDTSRVLGRFADILCARLFQHAHVECLARLAGIPVINALTDYAHPCQILADLLTIREHCGRLEGLTLAYLGDACNNVTHSLAFGCALMGLNLRIACPDQPAFQPHPDVLAAATRLTSEGNRPPAVMPDPMEAVQDADIVYTDSWMSYHIPAAQQEARTAILKPYQVDARKMALAKPEAVFMNCLPAMRGFEQTAEVLEGPQSIVFDQAENRLHAQKALLITLLEEAAR